MHHGDLDVTDFECRPCSSPRPALHPSSPASARVRDRDHHWIVFLRDFNRIADVVEVAVSAEHDIHLLEVFLLRRDTRDYP